MRKNSVVWLATLAVLIAAFPALAQTRQGKKVYIITDMEGVDGVFNWPDQCAPWQGARWQESRKLLTDEANAAVDGLFSGGATAVTVADLHDSSRALSTLTIDPRAMLLQGQNLPPNLGLDPSYSAVIFIGQHAMAGAKNAVLSHSYSFTIQNMWVNNRLAGEIGTRVMLAGYYGIPVIMLSGDQAACDEIHGLVPNARCAVVKWGISWDAGTSLSHKASCDLIRKEAEDAMQHLSNFKPYKLPNGPVTVKVEMTVETTPGYWPHRTGKMDNVRTYSYTGDNILDAWTKYRTRGH